MREQSTAAGESKAWQEFAAKPAELLSSSDVFQKLPFKTHPGMLSCSTLKLTLACLAAVRWDHPSSMRLSVRSQHQDSTSAVHVGAVHKKEVASR